MASTYLTRTPASAGNRKTWTWSSWIKTATTSGDKGIFSASTDASNRNAINLSNEGYFIFDYEVAGVRNVLSSQNATYRDVNGWYHLVVAVDTTQATDTNRVKMYVNGSQITLTGVVNDYPSQNADMFVNNTISHSIGRQDWGTSYFDGQMAHVHLIDGTSYDADTFGETDATTGIWKPKTAPSVTYGTNGFFLKFENSGAFGTDSSVNGNNFTVNGTMTQTIDTPSNVFATWNPLVKQGTSSNTTYSNGNTTIDFPAGGDGYMYSTLGYGSGKYYFEFKINSFTADRGHSVGLYTSDRLTSGSGSDSVLLQFCKTGNTNAINAFGSTVQTGLASFSNGDIIGVAVDADNGTVDFTKNGSTYGSQVTGLSSNFNGKDLFFGALGEGHPTEVRVFNASANFGNGYFGTTAVSSAENPDDGIGIFEYAVPTGYKALCTKSINAQEYD